MNGVLHPTSLHSTKDPQAHSTRANETANQTRQRISQTNRVISKGGESKQSSHSKPIPFPHLLTVRAITSSGHSHLHPSFSCPFPRCHSHVRESAKTHFQFLPIPLPHPPTDTIHDSSYLIQAAILQRIHTLSSSHFQKPPNNHFPYRNSSPSHSLLVCDNVHLFPIGFHSWLVLPWNQSSLCFHLSSSTQRNALQRSLCQSIVTSLFTANQKTLHSNHSSHSPLLHPSLPTTLPTHVTLYAPPSHIPLPHLPLPPPHPPIHHPRPPLLFPPRPPRPFLLPNQSSVSVQPTQPIHPTRLHHHHCRPHRRRNQSKRPQTVSKGVEHTRLHAPLHLVHSLFPSNRLRTLLALPIHGLLNRFHVTLNSIRIYHSPTHSIPTLHSHPLP